MNLEKIEKLRKLKYNGICFIYYYTINCTKAHGQMVGKTEVPQRHRESTERPVVTGNQIATFLL